MQAGTAASTLSQWEFHLRVYETEQSQVPTDAAGQVPRTSVGSSSGRDLQPTAIQKVLAECGIASIPDPDILLLLKINLTSRDKAVDPNKIARAFRCVEAYALNLYHRPWKKEYYRLKRYGGFYKAFVDTYLEGVEVIFHRIGYTLSEDSTEWQMLGMGGTEWVGEVSHSCLLIAFYCSVAAVECDCVAIACAQLGDRAYAPGQVFTHRLEQPALPLSTALQLRLQAQKSSAAATSVGRSRVPAAGTASGTTAIAQPPPAPAAAAAAAAAAAPFVSGGRWMQQPQRLETELSGAYVSGTSSISIDSGIIRVPPPAAAGGDLYAATSRTRRPPATTTSSGGSSSLLLTSRQHEPVEMSEPFNSEAWRSARDDVHAYGSGAQTSLHSDGTRLLNAAAAASPFASPGIADRRLPPSRPAAWSGGEYGPAAAAASAAAAAHWSSPPAPVAVAGLARISSLSAAAASSSDLRSLRAARPSSDYSSASSSWQPSRAAPTGSTAPSKVDRAPSKVDPDWKPEEATAEEHMAMSLQLLDEPPAAHLPPPPAFSSGSSSGSGALGNASGSRLQSGPGGLLRNPTGYRELTDRSRRLPVWESHGGSPGGGSSSSSSSGVDDDYEAALSMTSFSIREPPVGASSPGTAAVGADRTLKLAAASVAAPATASVGGVGRGSGLPSKPSASFPQYTASYPHYTASFPQYAAVPGSEEATGQRKQFSIYGRIDQ